MDIFDNEIEIIEHFQNIDTSSVLLLPSTPECEELFMSCLLYTSSALSEKAIPLKI